MSSIIATINTFPALEDVASFMLVNPPRSKKNEEKPATPEKPQQIADQSQEKNPKTVPEVDYISVRGKATVVNWKDGTRTVVLCGDTDTYNVYAAYCAALAKKIYGSTNAVHKYVDYHLSENINRRRQEEIEVQRREQNERARLNEERRIRKLAADMIREFRANQLVEELLTGRCECDCEGDCRCNGNCEKDGDTND